MITIARFGSFGAKVEKATTRALPQKPPQKKHPFDNPVKIVKGIHTLYTRKLIEKTSLNIVLCGVRVFRIMRNLEKEFTPLSQSSIDEAAKSMGIFQWPQGPAKDFPAPSGGDILRSILQNDPKQALRIELGYLKKPTGQNKSDGAPPDIPLHILIWYLTEQLKHCTSKQGRNGRPNYSLTVGFLDEQGIANKGYKTIQRLYTEQLKAKSLREDYEIFREAFEAPIWGMFEIDPMKGIPNVVSTDNPTENRDVSIFPIWEDYIPKSNLSFQKTP